MFNVIDSSKMNHFTRTFKDAGKYSKTTKCFSWIKDITSFDSKSKESHWCSWTSGNLTADYL